MGLQSRIMHIENKTGTLNETARTGRVTFSKTGRTIRYGGREFRSLKGDYKRNYFNVQTSEEFRISGPEKRGGDRLHDCNLRIETDADVREEYWRQIRGLPERIAEATTP